jgi:uncharacterized protein (DUF1919 family)
MNWHLQRWVKRVVKRYESWCLMGRSFVIVSNNCWGYELYDSVGSPYLTPFVGLFLFPECYISLLESGFAANLEKIRFTNSSRYYRDQTRYPVGVLDGGQEIHFLHERSADEAAGKWHRRVQRMKQALLDPRSKILFKFCDREGCTDSHLSRFHGLPFPNKISIGIRPFDAAGHVAVPYLGCRNKLHRDSVIDGQSLFRKRYSYFDITRWIKTGRVQTTAFSRLIERLNAFSRVRNSCS